MSQTRTKYKDNLTFSEALSLLRNKEFKMMRFKHPCVSFEGPFYHLHNHALCTTVGANEDGLKYSDPINLNEFTISQMSEPCWHVSSPLPPEGWVEMQYPKGKWSKPVVLNCWINIFYDYRVDCMVYNVYKEEEKADRDAKDVGDWTFIKKCFLQQQASIPWLEI